MKLNKEKKAKLRTKRVFLEQGTCSRTLFFILNRQFGNPKVNEERAADPLAGGIMQRGYQCGMLWGSTLAVGAESFRRNNNQDQAIATAIIATQYVVESFFKRTKSLNCQEITSCNFLSKWGLAKFIFSGKMYSCFKLAEKWVPEAIQSATEGLSHEQTNLPKMPISCASEVAKKMGASDEEIVMVAGFAGGIGISGNGCGALGASIWLSILELVRKDNWKYSLSDPVTEGIIEKFNKITNYEMECHEITGKRFLTIEDHAEFIKNGGCAKLINVLSGHNSFQ